MFCVSLFCSCNKVNKPLNSAWAQQKQRKACSENRVLFEFRFRQEWGFRFLFPGIESNDAKEARVRGAVHARNRSRDVRPEVRPRQVKKKVGKLVRKISVLSFLRGKSIFSLISSASPKIHLNIIIIFFKNFGAKFPFFTGRKWAPVPGSDVLVGYLSVMVNYYPPWYFGVRYSGFLASLRSCRAAPQRRSRAGSLWGTLRLLFAFSDVDNCLYVRAREHVFAESKAARMKKQNLPSSSRKEQKERGGKSGIMRWETDAAAVMMKSSWFYSLFCFLLSLSCFTDTFLQIQFSFHC